MYTKGELEQMDTVQLITTAEQMGIKVSQNDEREKVIYDILDKAAIDSAASESAQPKKKRTRIAKKDTDHVYSVTGNEGEDMDNKGKSKSKAKKKSKQTDVSKPDKETPDKEIPATENSTETPPLPLFPKHRGRKSKAELAAIAAAEAAKLTGKEEEIAEAQAE